MEYINFSLDEYNVKTLIIDTETQKSIIPVLSAIYKEHSEDTPERVIIKDYELYIEQALQNKSVEVKESITRSLNRFYALCQQNSYFTKQDALLDEQAKEEVLKDPVLLSDFRGKCLFFFALVRYLGEKMLKGLDTPLIVEYSPA